MELASSLILPQTGIGALNDGAGVRFDNPLSITGKDDHIDEFAMTVEIYDYSKGYRVAMVTLALTQAVSTGKVIPRTRI